MPGAVPEAAGDVPEAAAEDVLFETGNGTELEAVGEPAVPDGAVTGALPVEYALVLD